MSNFEFGIAMALLFQFWFFKEFLISIEKKLDKMIKIYKQDE